MNNDDIQKINYGKFDPKILDKVACPVTKGSLTYDKEKYHINPLVK